MSAVYGILGDADAAELKAVGDRLAHRGSARAEWSPAPGVHFGLRASAAVLERARDGVAVFDGFIDNPAQLARMVGRPPELGDPGSDTALVLALFTSFGTERF